MPEPWWASLLPARAARDVFEPAWRDLRIAHLDACRRARAQSRLTRGALEARHLGRVFLLFLDCWRLALVGALASRRPARIVTDVPPKEWLTMLLYLTRHGFRLLVREPGFTAAALLTLALGVGANVAVFAIVEAVLLRPLPYSDAARLVILDHRDKRTGISKEFIAIGDYVDLAARQSTFEAIASYGGQQATISGIGEPFRVSALTAGPDLFGTLRLRVILGRTLQADDSRPGAAPVIVLGYDVWSNHFGADPHIVGRAVKVGQTARQVVGVATQGFRFPPNGRTDVIVPLEIPLVAPAERKSDWTFAVARLKPNVTVQDANVNLAAISSQLEQDYPRSNQGSQYFVVPLRDALVGDTKPALVLLLAAVGVVLLVACANVANLLLARSLARGREMAVRMALGASRARLVAQLLAESLILALAAGLVGAVVATWGAHALVALVPKSVNVPGLANVRINAGVLLFTLGLSVVTALIFGLVSALTVRTQSASGALIAPGRVSMTAAARRAASALVVLEVALAITLLMGAGLILRSFAHLLAVDPGFRTDRVMTMGIAVPVDRYRDVTARRAFYDRAFAALKASPAVQEVGAAVVVPLTGNNWTVGFERADRPVPAGERPPEVGWQAASGGFFKVLQIPLLAGRLFDATDKPGGKPVLIASEAIERRFFPNESAVGRSLKIGDQTAEIVGVVGNIRRADLRDEPRADLYFPFEMRPDTQITLFIRTAADPVRALPSLQTTLKALEPNVIFAETETLAAIASDSVQVTHLALWLLAIFAATALTLAAVGIYGVMSYVVRQRTREIGMRAALGATRFDIVWLVMRQGALIATIGTALGLGLGLVAVRSLGTILFGVSPSDPATLGLAGVVLIATTMAACYIPARRAASVDPARTLAEQ